MGRALAAIETVSDIAEIAGADQVVRARVRGWDVVVKRGEFKVGDPCCYIEVDSMLDVSDPRFEFLAGKGVRTDAEGHRGHVLKTIRLRGQYSQGLALPLRDFPELDGSSLGDDVTDVLKIRKWDPPIPAQLSGQVRGPRPSWIPKTDEERIQNLAGLLDHRHEEWESTEKLDGCLQGRTRIDMADGTKRPIRQIQVGDYVMGMDRAGHVVPTEVLRTWRRPPTEEWLRIQGRRLGLGRGNSHFVLNCTPNHHLWLPDAGTYRAARDIRGGDRLLAMRSELALTPMQRSVLLGKLLGDGSIKRGSHGSWAVYWSHREDDREYVDWVRLACGVMAMSGGDATSGYGTRMARAHTVESPLIREAFSDFIDATGRKIVPKSVMADLDPIALATWYMDDGSLSHHEGQEDRCVISSNGFTYEEHLILQVALERLGITATIFESRGKGLSLRVNSRDAERLFLMVAPYVVPCMQRKLPARYRGGPGWLPPDGPNQFQPILVSVPVDTVECVVPPPEVSKVRYDLTTDTSNFFANGTLVHNSSCSFWVDGDDQGVCSRNLDLIHNSDNTLWRLAERLDIFTLMRSWGLGGCWGRGERTAVQGEAYGEGIQGNPLAIKGQRFAAFGLIVDGVRVPRSKWPADLAAIEVPTRALMFPRTVDEALEEVDGLESVVTPGKRAEGIVWRVRDKTHLEVDGVTVRASVKVISNRYLLKHDRD